ncbi:MAG: PAS domain-containing protein [Thermodesulfobacteriota bacterium]
MRIRHKILLGVLLSALIPLTAGGVYYAIHLRLSAATASLHAIDQVFRAVLDLAILSNSLGHGDEAQTLRQWQEQHAAMACLILAIDRDEPEIAALAGQLSHKHLALGGLFDSLAGSQAAGPAEDAATRERRARRAEQLTGQLQSMLADAQDLKDRSHLRFMTVQEALSRQGLLTLTVMALGLMVVLGVLYRGMTRPLAELHRGAVRLGQGELAYRVPLAAADEFGEMAGAFNHMAAQLEAARAVLDEEAAARRQTEEELRQAKDELERYFAVIPDLLCVAAPDGSFQKLNPAWTTTLGYPLEELLATPLAARIHPDDLAEMERHLAGEPTRAFTNRYRHRDGSWRWLEWNATPAAGGRLYAAARDITARRAAEEALRESQQMFALFMRHTPVYTFIKRLENGVSRSLAVSDNYRDMLGVSAREMIGKTMEELFPLDFARKITADDFAVVASGQVLELDEDFGGRHYTTIKFPIVRPDGSTLLAGFTIDITRRRRAEEQLRELNRTLEARVEEETRARLDKERLLVQQSKLAAMGEMLGAIAHQWRQPLNAVAVIVQDVQDAFSAGLLDGAYLRRATTQAMAQICFMSRTIDDFRNFFQPDKARTLFDAKKAVVRVLELLSPQLASHDILWSLTCLVHQTSFGPGEEVEECPAMHLYGFENELKQVFLSLLGNAQDAILARRAACGQPEHGRVQVSFAREDSRVVIRVADNGGGIPDLLLDRVFEPYFSTKEPGQGTGIGLYMAKMIIEKNMGGSLSVRNTGDGAELQVALGGPQS